MNAEELLATATAAMARVPRRLVSYRPGSSFRRAEEALPLLGAGCPVRMESWPCFRGMLSLT